MVSANFILKKHDMYRSWDCLLTPAKFLTQLQMHKFYVIYFGWLRIYNLIGHYFNILSLSLLVSI